MPALTQTSGRKTFGIRTDPAEQKGVRWREGQPRVLGEAADASWAEPGRGKSRRSLLIGQRERSRDVR